MYSIRPTSDIMHDRRLYTALTSSFNEPSSSASHILVVTLRPILICPEAIFPPPASRLSSPVPDRASRTRH